MTINYQIENNNAERLFIRVDQNKPKYMKLILIGHKSKSKVEHINIYDSFARLKLY